MPISLLGDISRERFFSEYWGKKSFHEHANASHFSSLFGWRDFNRLMNFVPLRPGEINLYRDADAVAFSDFATADGSLVDPRKLLAHAQRGYSIALFNVETKWLPIAAYLRELRQDWPAKFSVSLYFTPEHSRCFGAHRDPFGSFILQIEGEKRWWLGDIDDESCRVDENAPLKLGPGDVLFLPRGIPHRAQCDAKPSLHLTLRLHPLSPADAMEVFFSRRGAEQAYWEGEWLARAAANPHAIADWWRSWAASESAQALIARATIDALNEKGMGDAHASVRLPEDLEAPPIEPSTRLAARGRCWYQVEQTGEANTLFAAGFSWATPFSKALIDRMLDGSSFQIGEIGKQFGASIEALRDLSQSLFRVGVLGVVPQ